MLMMTNNTDNISGTFSSHKYGHTCNTVIIFSNISTKCFFIYIAFCSFVKETVALDVYVCHNRVTDIPLIKQQMKTASALCVPITFLYKWLKQTLQHILFSFTAQIKLNRFTLATSITRIHEANHTQTIK